MLEFKRNDSGVLEAWDGNKCLGSIMSFGDNNGQESENEDGGPGSGNFGHEGRPGKVGGAAKGEGSSNESAAKESGASKLKSMSDNDFQKSTGYSKRNPDSAKVAYYLADKGFQPKEIKETKRLFDRHSFGNEPQKNADNEISAHIEDEDAIGRLMLDKSEIEEKALRESGTTEFYRKGALDKDVLAFTDDPEGATMPIGENGELEHIGWDVNVSLDDLLAKGYRPIAGGNCADVGSPSEKEILFAKFPDASSYEDLNSIRSKEAEAAKEYSKSYKSLIPENSYFNDPSYDNDSKKFTDCNKVIDDSMKIVEDLEKRIATEGVIKPRSEWTEEDEVDAMLGEPPMKYPEKVKGYQMAKDSILTSINNVEKDRDAANERMKKAKQKAHDEQIKSVNFDKPVKALSDDYEGFTTKTTGTGYDEYLNGKQSGGYIAEMSPAEYLKRCAYQVFENATIESTLAAINEKNVDEYAKKMESGEKFDMPYLNLKKGEQEGRHRAAAAMKAGIEKIPVLVVGYKQNADSTDTHGSVGVLVIKDGRILCGIRSGNTAPGCICGPGGHIESGETPEQAAIRETQEEFGITPKDLVPIGNGPAESDTGYSPNLFLCTDYEGEPNCTSNEMSWAQFVDLDKFADNPPSMFQPFADSIICLLNAMSGDDHEDGGPGSGHFGHESEKGKRGGSVKSHARLEGCSESTKKLIDEALENPYGYGGVDTEARKQSIRSALEKDGVKVTVDEDGLSMAFSPKFSYDDCIDANIAMNGYNMLGRKDYIRQCNDAGSEPLLHETPEALQYVDKPDDGNLSIYDRFNSYNALNDDDLVKYGAFDHDQNPNGNEDLTKASISAIESLTPEQHEALVGYTQQYGAATYTEINHYLTSSDEEKTGYSDVVAKNAAAITKALDKEIGADCLVSRGQSDLIGIAPDKKLENYVKQISKCNFKNASKLKQALEGKVIQNDAVMSTSAGNSAGDYSACSVQLLLKTPAKAKAVDLSAVSAYGTHSEVEKALAAAMGQSLSYEHEVAFKPGTQYKIDSVDIGFRPASRDRKKPSAYIYITGAVLTDDERTDGVFFAGELDDHAQGHDQDDDFFE